MSFTENEIKKYFDIIQKYTKPQEKDTDRKTRCWHCKESDFDLVSGFKICTNCGCQNEAVLGYFDNKEYDRLHFRKKSFYQRKYHFEKKVNQLSKRLKLTEDEKYDLYNKLMEIDNRIMEELNKKFNRKRSINVIFLIKKILEEMNNPKHSLVELSIGDQTLVNYEKWWQSYKSLNTSVKNPVNDPSQIPKNFRLNR